MSSYDGLLGRIFDNGEEVEQRGGLNFIGVTITQNETLNCLNVAFTGLVGDSTQIPVSGAAGFEYDASFTYAAGELSIPAAGRLKAAEFTLISRDTTDVNIAGDTNGVNNTLRLRPGGTSGRMGFFGATPVAKQILSGDRSDGTALTNLITLLAALGLLTDETAA